MIMDNGCEKNLVSQEIFQLLDVSTTADPTPHQVTWVHKDGPHLMVTQHCVITFDVGPFRDIFVYVVSSLGCVDLLLGVPQQYQCQYTSHARTHQYYLQQDDMIYVYTSSPLKSLALFSKNVVLYQIIHNKCVSLCLVCPVKLNNSSHLIPIDMVSSLTEYEDLFSAINAPSPSRSIEHTVNLILGASLLTPPSYHMDPMKAYNIEHQIQQHLKSISIFK